MSPLTRSQKNAISNQTEQLVTKAAEGDEETDYTDDANAANAENAKDVDMDEQEQTGQADGNEQTSAEATSPGQSSQNQPVTSTEGKQDQGVGNNNAPVKTEAADDSLFVPQTDPPKPSDNSGSKDSDSEDPDSTEPLFGVPVHVLGKDVTTVSWSSQARGGYINRYGKKGYMRFRIDDTTASGYVKDSSQDYHKTALGDEKKGKKFVYTKDDFTGRIWGVAWKGEGGEDDLDLIDPNLAGKRKDSTGNSSGKNWPETRVLVEWKEAGKRWETRTTVRRLWGTKADARIFEAAKKAESAYNGAGKDRAGYTRSPEAALLYESLAKFMKAHLIMMNVSKADELTTAERAKFTHVIAAEMSRLSI
jgi:hypothetical protein